MQAIHDHSPSMEEVSPGASVVERRRSTRLAIRRVLQNKTGVVIDSASKRKSGDVDVDGSQEGSDSDLTPLESDDDLHLPVSIPTPKEKRKAWKKQKQKATTDGNDSEDVACSEKRARRKRAPKPEPEYVIPDVEQLETTFRGRLGYACLNTILRNKRPASEAVFCSRTCRLDTINQKGIGFAKDLGRKNVENLLTIIQWNEDNNIRFMRISSELFPYASHPVHGYTLDYCAALLSLVGALANKYGHRLTAHPGQFTQLGSPKPSVVDAAVRELVYHCEMLDRMRIGKDGVMIVHGGGVYDDKQATLERIKQTITMRLPQNVRDRLVLENDELCYNAEDLLPLCEELDIPLVFDYHHDALYPSSIPPRTIIQRANAIWARRGIKPKQHLSEPRPGAETLMEKRAHADRCQRLPEELDDDMDLMIEAKDKEQAVLHLYRIYNLHPVIHANLRPPSENQTKETKGRKSNKRARAKALALAEAEAKELGFEADDAGDEDVTVEVEAEAEGVSEASIVKPRKRSKSRAMKGC